MSKIFSSSKTKEEKYGLNNWEKHKLVGGSCARCQKAFGLVSVRHHCRRCGFVICSDCQHSSKMKLAGSSNEKIVCKACAFEMDGNLDNFDITASHHPTSHNKGACPTLSEFTYNCKACGETIFGQTITLADGSKLHADCFKCCVDQEKITGGYAEIDGNIYCAEHYEELFCETCGGCSQKIVEGLAVDALGSKWHGDCFVCSMCSTPLSVGSACQQDAPLDADGKPSDAEKISFSFYLHNGDVYCAKDFMENFSGKCSGCGFVVDSGFLVKGMGASWHQECFVCYECKEPFANMSPPVYCVGSNGRPYCETHRFSQQSDNRATVLRSLQCPTSPKTPLMQSASLLVGPSNVTAIERGACLAHGIFKAHHNEAPEYVTSITTDTSDSRVTSYMTEMTVKQRITAHITTTTTGGIAATMRSSDNTFKKHRQLKFDEGCEEYKGSFELEVFAHEVFKDLRLNAFGVSEEEYRNSIGMRPLSGGGKGEGKSGNLFFVSWDHKYIIKTVDNEEVPFFQTCLRDYHRHMFAERPIENGEQVGVTRSFLPKFFGFYVLKLPREPVLRVVVMANVFPPGIDLVEKYDLKGVLGSKRFVSEEEQEEGVSVLKDRNFMSRTVSVGEDMRRQLLQQLTRDVRFLQDHGRMDYSLLLGIANLTDVQPPPQGWPSTDSHGLQSVPQQSQQWGSITSMSSSVRADPSRTFLCGGEEVFFMGIIDILEEYTAKKAVEGALKSLRHQATHLLKTSAHATKSTAVSAVSASHYGRRFLEFLSSRIT